MVGDQHLSGNVRSVQQTQPAGDSASNAGLDLLNDGCVEGFGSCSWLGGQGNVQVLDAVTPVTGSGPAR